MANKEKSQFIVAYNRINEHKIVLEPKTDNLTSAEDSQKVPWYG